MAAYQKVGDDGLKRYDHVWFKRNGRWKCCLCGAVTRKMPPPHRLLSDKTADTWLPQTFESLTDQERALCPPEVSIE